MNSTTTETMSSQNDHAAASILDQAKQQAQQVIGQIQPQGGKLLDTAKDKINESLHTQKDQATGTLHGVAEALRTTGQQLNQKGQGTFGGYADTLAGEIEKIESYLQNRDVTDLAAELGGFARRQPALFISSAFVLGVLAARFLKASGEANTNPYHAPTAQDGALVPVTTGNNFNTSATSTTPSYAAPTYANPATTPMTTPASSPETVLPTSYDEPTVSGNAAGASAESMLSKTGFTTETGGTTNLTDSTLVD